MKKPDLIKQLANRINQPHVIESWINKIEKAAYNKGYKDAETKQYNISDVVSSAEVPAVRVRNYNEETSEVEDGTVIEATLNTYLVIPDYNLSMTVRWDKMNCDVLR